MTAVVIGLPLVLLLGLIGASWYSYDQIARASLSNALQASYEHFLPSWTNQHKEIQNLLKDAEATYGHDSELAAELRVRLDEHDRLRPASPPHISRAVLGVHRAGLLGCLALVLWPVIPGFIRASDPLSSPGWGWLLAAAIPAIGAVWDFLAHRSSEASTKPKQSVARSGAATAGLAAALVLGGMLTVPASAANGTVRKVTSGDSIVVSVRGVDLPVRMLNIDTADPNDPDECLGQQAKDFTKNLVSPGTRVQLNFGKRKFDEQGRLWATVRFDHGKPVANELAKAGLGIPVKASRNDPVYGKTLGAFKKAAAQQQGYFDPGVECTFPAEQQLLTRAAKKAKTADAGTTAAEAANAAATVYSLYQAPEETAHEIREGDHLAYRAMRVAGLGRRLLSYELQTNKLEDRYQSLDSEAHSRKEEEAEEAARKKAAEEAARNAAEAAAAAAAQRAADQRAAEQARQFSDNSSSSGSDDSGGGGGASAVCRDGSLSYSAHRQGTCSHHGGVAKWL